jgi:GntR family transcriptional regulator, rspAB operon transcriptional repressor
MDTVNGFTINQTKISEQVYGYLRGAIMSGHLAPGERLDIERMGEQLKISKMPIKEAVGRLAAEGLLDIQSRRGTYVSRVDARELAETFEIRRALEVLVTPADIEKLQLLIAEMEASAEHQDVARHLEKNFEFHETIIGLSGNQKLLTVYRQLRTPIHIAGVHHRSANWVERVAQEQREHRAIVRALRQRDAEAVTRAMTEHLKRARVSLVGDVERSSKP